MKKLIFIIVIGVALFAQEQPKYTPQQQEMINQIQMLKGSLSDIKTQREQIYEALTRNIATQLELENRINSLSQQLQKTLADTTK
jgi:hypothetical protein